MDPELNSSVKENLRLTREISELLHKMNNAQKWGRFFRIFYWLVIIGFSVGVYYYLQGPLEQLLGTYKGLLDSVEKVQKGASSLPDVNMINSLLEKFKLPSSQ